MNVKSATLGLLVALAAGPALSQQAQTQAASTASAEKSAAADGEVRKVDKETKKITIRHGPITNLDMPGGMTMVFRVQDPGMLDTVKAGDKIRFHAEKTGGLFTVTRIEPVK